MSEPVKRIIEEDLLNYIAVTLKVARDDLTAYVDDEYPAHMRAQYPTYERRWRNSMETVTDAQYCLDQLADAGIRAAMPTPTEGET